jgi:hypothetical protein
MTKDSEAKMTHVQSAVLRAAYRLQHFYRYLAPGSRPTRRGAPLRATVPAKRSFVG